MAEQLGPYLLESRIGSGGMADVFLARGPSGVCVVKRPHPHLCANPEFVRMFLDEASVLAQLYHPGIAHIFDLGQSAGVYYLAMEYVPGFDLMTISLEHERQGEFMAADLAAKVIADAAGALDYAHRAMGKNGQPLGLIHRDVTPHNILVSTSGEVKVIDFGVARAAKSMHHTAAGLVKGKYPYMAPEQITGQAIDSRVDIYALGLVLYELLTNARAIAGELEFEQIDNARAARIKPVEQLRPNVPGPLKQILAQALHPQAAGRYQTAGQMQTELLNYLQTERHVVGREDLVRLFRVVAAEAAHQLPTFAPGHGDLSIRETMPARDAERIEDTLPPPSGTVPPLPSPMPSPQRSDTYPSNARAKADAHTSRTDKSAAHQIPVAQPFDPSTRPTDANVRVELKFGGAAAPPIQLETPAEHPTYPGLPPPTKLIPSKAAHSMGLSPLDSSFRRTIVNPKKPPYLIVAFTLALLVGAGAVAWLYLREPSPAQLPPKPVIEPPVKPVSVEPFDAAVAVVVPVPLDASVAPAAPDASTAVAEVTAEAGLEFAFNVSPAVAVIVDGKNYGTSPLTVRLSPGPHQVALQFGDGSGYVYRDRVTVAEGGARAFTRRFQKLPFEAWFDDFSPQSATIDGRQVGAPGFNVVRVNLWEGSHLLVAVGEVGGVKKTIRQPFLVKVGNSAEMRFKFASDGH